ncbi:MAG: LysM peptidoglycan-binding domain-containing protein [Streptosporangiaceae bacterium]
MSALSAIEAPVLTGTVVPAAGHAGERRQQQRLRLVAPSVAGPPGAGSSGAGDPRASSTGHEQWRRPAAGVTAAPTPVRLTRRGRIVVTTLAALCATAAVLLVSLLASGGAQASNHGQPGRGGYQGMHQIVVQPGQTLWSIASAAEPTADPRAVIQQIMSVNALNGSNIQVGQLLWVPR